MNSSQHKLLFMLLAILASSPNALADTASKNAIEAAFLYNFALFTQWPNLAASNSFNICVLTENPFGAAFERLSEKRIENLPVRTQIMRTPEEAVNCHILFVPASGHRAMQNIANTLKDAPVLIVSEVNGYNPNEVMIMLGEESGRVNFQINHSATQRVGLNVSSKLLRLARRVY